MPFSFPRISFKINMQGVGPLMQRKIGTSFEPFDLYEIYNTARDPDGQPYFNAVNDGTGIKYVKNIAALRSSHESAGHKGVMTFFAGGHPISQRVAGPNPPYHMRERAIPLIRKYWAARVTQIFSGRKASFKLFYDKTYTRISGDQFTAPKMYAKAQSSVSGQGATRDNWWTQALEDTMDFAVEKLAELTPVLKAEYDSGPLGYTPRRGLLRDSYAWAQKAAILGVRGLLPQLGSMSKRLTFTGRSKHELFATQQIAIAQGRLTRHGEKVRSKYSRLLAALRRMKASISRKF